jgi:hypothetical protein
VLVMELVEVGAVFKSPSWGGQSWGGQVGVGRSVNTGLRAGICVGDGVGRSWGGVQKSKLGRSSWGGQVGVS